MTAGRLSGADRDGAGGEIAGDGRGLSAASGFGTVDFPLGGTPAAVPVEVVALAVGDGAGFAAALGSVGAGAAGGSAAVDGGVTGSATVTVAVDDGGATIAGAGTSAIG
jgi:hypothetical protein